MLGTCRHRGKHAVVRHQLGLDEPLLVQYAHFLQGIIRGDLGQSFSISSRCVPLVVERIPVSVGWWSTRR